jgi:hypothetical protein
MIQTKQKTIQIQVKDILSLACSLVKKAKKELLLTMLIKEELETPLPLFYVRLLQRRVKQGVKIKRLCFGKKEGFGKIAKLPISQGIELINITNQRFYKRMLMRDREEMIFANKKNKKIKFFYSKDSKTVKKYVDFFQELRLRFSSRLG